jgi:hypothetical protein
MLDRGAVLAQYRVELPELSLSLAAGAMRVAMLLLIVGAAGWGMFELAGRLTRGASGASTLAQGREGK